MKTSRAVLIITLLMVGCNNKPSNNELNAVGVGECVPYFQFNAITHYRIDISEDSVFEIREKLNKSGKEDQLIEVLSDELVDDRYTMNDISDTVKLMSLEELGFQKNKISKINFNVIDSLFCKQHLDEIEKNMCIPIYRDVLLFRNVNRIVGFARICFDCGMSNIIGSERDTKDFGQTGEFQKLEKLLKQVTSDETRVIN